MLDQEQLAQEKELTMISLKKGILVSRSRVTPCSSEGARGNRILGMVAQGPDSTSQHGHVSAPTLPASNLLPPPGVPANALPTPPVPPTPRPPVTPGSSFLAPASHRPLAL